MQIMKQMYHRILAPAVSLMVLGEGMLEQIAEHPDQPFFKTWEKGYGLETVPMYTPDMTAEKLIAQGAAAGARRVDVSYDFFFGGDRRENYPDSPLTLQAYRTIYALSRKYGLGFSASIISPLDAGGGYIKTHSEAGRFMQYETGNIAPDGSFAIEMPLQCQWTNNKGPAKIQLAGMRVFAFEQESQTEEGWYAVRQETIQDITEDASYNENESDLVISPEGYGYRKITISGKAARGKPHFMAVLIYNTPELDYFSEDALPYLKSLIDLHRREGIQYDGFYSDEMHIQFDWDRTEHWADTEIKGCYVSKGLEKAYASLYGDEYADFARYLLYFGSVCFGSDREDILKTWQFRKRYYELLHRQVTSLCREAREYAESVFGKMMITTGHSTWQESPVSDSFYKTGSHLCEQDRPPFGYDYTKDFYWSAALRENISACNDHFLWNDYFQAVGTDIGEGGFLDRNYMGEAFTASLAALNRTGYAYYCIWGSPEPIRERQAEIAVAYGLYANYCDSFEIGHNLLQGFRTRLSNVLSVCPTELNYANERFGNWMIQYGYTDYITEQKLLEFAHRPDSPLLQVKNRSYKALIFFYSPMISKETMKLIKEYVEAGGKVIWCSAPPESETNGTAALFREIFNLQSYDFPITGVSAENQLVHFTDGTEPMRIPTALFPDHIYPVQAPDYAVLAVAGEQIVGTKKTYPGGGKAIYLGFRVRDDQSGQAGKDVNTLFSLLCKAGCYEDNSPERESRPKETEYLYNRFPNGTVTVCRHFRTFPEGSWKWGFYRDQDADSEYMQHISLPSHSILLQEEKLDGHQISYRGTGLVTYRYQNYTGLTALAGRDTTGITVDDKDYIFSENPVTLVWGKLSDDLLSEDVKEAWILKCNSEALLHIPVSMKGFSCKICKSLTTLPDPEKPYPFENNENSATIDISKEAIGRWIIWYNKKEVQS